MPQAGQGWSGVPVSSCTGSSQPEIKPTSPAWQVGSLPQSHWNPTYLPTSCILMASLGPSALPLVALEEEEGQCGMDRGAQEPASISRPHQHAGIGISPRH